MCHVGQMGVGGLPAVAARRPPARVPVLPRVRALLHVRHVGRVRPLGPILKVPRDETSRHRRWRHDHQPRSHASGDPPSPRLCRLSHPRLWRLFPPLLSPRLSPRGWQRALAEKARDVKHSSAARSDRDPRPVCARGVALTRTQPLRPHHPNSSRRREYRRVGVGAGGAGGSSRRCEYRRVVPRASSAASWRPSPTSPPPTVHMMARCRGSVGASSAC